MNGKENNEINLGSLMLAVLVVIVVLVGFSFASSTITAVSNFISPVKTAAVIDSKPKNTATILLVGDIMLDRNVRNTIDSGGFNNFFSGVKSLIEEPDLAVANLEGPFTTNASLTASLVDKQLTFTFDPSLAPELSRIGFDVLGLANNHALNFGREGLNVTKQAIRESNMHYYGDPNNTGEISYTVNVNGIWVGFVGFHEFSYMNFDKVLAEIDRLRPDVDVLIVSPHWGVEYQKEPTKNQQKWGHEFIDHGADAVIGAHPHVVESSEQYKGKMIYYSLGNFAFDQYFSDETMRGLAIKMDIKKNAAHAVSINYTEIPINVGKKGITVAASSPIVSTISTK